MDLLDRLATATGATPPDDRFELVRGDLASTATTHRLRCVARVVVAAASPDEWNDIALDLRARSSPLTAHALVPAYEAAESLATGDLEGAVKRLADSCGQSVAEWIADARVEQGR